MSITAAALLCLSSVIYHEARGESLEGQLAVAHVVLNRVESPHFPDTVCGVVTQPYQFSWYPERPLVDHKADLAAEVLEGNTESPVGDSLYFHSLSYNPWGGSVQYVTRIGGHTFYE